MVTSRQRKQFLRTYNRSRMIACSQCFRSINRSQSPFPFFDRLGLVTVPQLGLYRLKRTASVMLESWAADTRAALWGMICQQRLRRLRRESQKDNQSNASCRH